MHKECPFRGYRFVASKNKETIAPSGGYPLLVCTIKPYEKNIFEEHKYMAL
jgi:hypothetical protein